jgi:hypothetical protein
MQLCGGAAHPVNARRMPGQGAGSGAHQALIRGGYDPLAAHQDPRLPDPFIIDSALLMTSLLPECFPSACWLNELNACFACVLLQQDPPEPSCLHSFSSALALSVPVSPAFPNSPPPSGSSLAAAFISPSFQSFERTYLPAHSPGPSKTFVTRRPAFPGPRTPDRIRPRALAGPKQSLDCGAREPLARAPSLPVAVVWRGSLPSIHPVRSCLIHFIKARLPSPAPNASSSIPTADTSAEQSSKGPNSAPRLPPSVTQHHAAPLLGRPTNLRDREIQRSRRSHPSGPPPSPQPAEPGLLDPALPASVRALLAAVLRVAQHSPSFDAAPAFHRQSTAHRGPVSVTLRPYYPSQPLHLALFVCGPLWFAVSSHRSTAKDPGPQPQTTHHRSQ